MGEFDAASSYAAQERGQTGTKEEEKWQAPSAKFHKANWDAALNHRSETIGIGIVIRNNEGRVKASKCSACT